MPVFAGQMDTEVTHYHSDVSFLSATDRGCFWIEGTRYWEKQMKKMFPMETQVFNDKFLGKHFLSHCSLRLLLIAFQCNAKWCFKTNVFSGVGVVWSPMWLKVHCVFSLLSQFPGIFELGASTKENINIRSFSAKYD